MLVDNEVQQVVRSSQRIKARTWTEIREKLSCIFFIQVFRSFTLTYRFLWIFTVFILGLHSLNYFFYGYTKEIFEIKLNSTCDPRSSVSNHGLHVSMEYPDWPIVGSHILQFFPHIRLSLKFEPHWLRLSYGDGWTVLDRSWRANRCNLTAKLWNRHYGR